MLKLFTYGTLKQGGRLCDSYFSDATFIDEAVTVKRKFLMMASQHASFPYVFHYPTGSEAGLEHIKGEVWNVPLVTLAALVRMESASGYTPIEVKVNMADSSKNVTAYMFVVHPEGRYYASEVNRTNVMAGQAYHHLSNTNDFGRIAAWDHLARDEDFEDGFTTGAA